MTHPEPTPESVERRGPRSLTADEAVEKALLHTFQLSDEDYRQFQTAFSESVFIRALEQDGWTVAATRQADRGDGLREAVKQAATALDQSTGDRYAIEARGILRAALRDTAPSGLDVETLDLAVMVLAGTGEIAYDYKRPVGREARRIAYRLSIEYARLRDEGASGTPAAE
jgi:hypothetical protein